MDGADGVGEVESDPAMEAAVPPRGDAFKSGFLTMEMPLGGPVIQECRKGV